MLWKRTQIQYKGGNQHWLQTQRYFYPSIYFKAYANSNVTYLAVIVNLKIVFSIFFELSEHYLSEIN